MPVPTRFATLQNTCSPYQTGLSDYRLSPNAKHDQRSPRQKSI